jgi:hypothetical protein
MYEVYLPNGKVMTIKDFALLKDMATAGMFDADTMVLDKTQDHRFRAGDHPVIARLLPPPPKPTSVPLPDSRAGIPFPEPPDAPPLTGPAAGHAPKPSAPSIHGGTTPADNTFVSEEMVRQFTACNWWVFWGVLAIFGFFTSIISLVFFIYAIIRKQGIRQRAAELGINPDEIALAANTRFWQSGGPIIKVFGILAACLVGLFVFVGVIGASCSPRPEPVRQPYYPRYSQ